MAIVTRTKCLDCEHIWNCDLNKVTCPKDKSELAVDITKGFFEYKDKE